MSEEPGQVPPPFPLAIVVADAIHRDPATGKSYILGTFSGLAAADFPASHPSLALYVSLSGGRGKVPVRVDFVRTNEDDEIVASAEAEVEFPDPRTIVDIALTFQGLVFPAPGEYRFQVFAADEFMGERRILMLGRSEGEQHE